MLATLLYGKFLDIKRFTQKQRAWYGLVVWAVPQAIGLVWLCIMWNLKYPTNVALDYGANPGAWAAAYFPFLIVFTTSFWVQIYLYWILSTFSTDVKAASRTGGLFRAWETAGQTTAYAVCAKSYRGRYMTYVNIALMLASLVVLPFLLKLIPERPLAVDDVVGDRVEVERVDRKVNDIEE